MSLLNFIIQDKLLVITISVVGALLFLGLLLMVISSVRAVLQRSSDAAEDDLEAITESPLDEDTEIMLPVPVAAVPVQAAPIPVTPPPETNDMQKLLNTVFTDEEYSSRRKALFDSVKPVDAKALAKLANETAARMGVKAKANS